MASQALLTPSPLLKPLVTLAGWTFVMELWMYATRIPAISNYKLSTDPAKISEELQTKIPIHIRQVADKYVAHLQKKKKLKGYQPNQTKSKRSQKSFLFSELRIYS